MNDKHAGLVAISEEDASGLERAEREYGSSWKRRGGIGAFMMLARKWDRIERAVDKSNQGGDFDFMLEFVLRMDTRSEGAIDDIRDLRRYLLLVGAEHRAAKTGWGTHLEHLAAVAKDDVLADPPTEPLPFLWGRIEGHLTTADPEVWRSVFLPECEEDVSKMRRALLHFEVNMRLKGVIHGRHRDNS